MKDPIFKDNPKLKAYHKTSDGEAFYTAHDAANHAKSLKNRNVEEVKNPALLEAVDAEEVNDSQNDETTGHEGSADGSEKELGDDAAASDATTSPADDTTAAAQGDGNTAAAADSGSGAASADAPSADAPSANIQHHMASDEGKQVPAAPAPKKAKAPKNPAAPKKTSTTNKK